MRAVGRGAGQYFVDALFAVLTATLGLGLATLPSLGSSTAGLVALAISGMIAAAVGVALAAFVEYVDRIKPLYIIFIIALMLYDVPAAHGYIASFAELTLGVRDLHGYLAAGLIAVVLLLTPRRLLYNVKAMILAGVIIVFTTTRSTPLGAVSTNPIGSIALILFSYVGFSLPMDVAREAKKTGSEEAINAVIKGVACGFTVVMAIYTALGVIGYYGLVRYDPGALLAGKLVGMLGLTAYAGFLKGVYGQLRELLGVERALVAVIAVNVMIPLIVTTSGLRIEEYLVLAGALGGVLQYSLGVFIALGTLFLRLLEKHKLLHTFFRSHKASENSHVLDKQCRNG